MDDYMGCTYEPNELLNENLIKHIRQCFSSSLCIYYERKVTKRKPNDRWTGSLGVALFQSSTLLFKIN
jgi:hypothetical protein